MEVRNGLFSVVMLLTANLGATQIWTYTSPPILTYQSGDPNLRPAGLGDHFDITVTFDTNINPGETRIVGILHETGLDGVTLDWIDGTDNHIGFGNPDQLFVMATFSIDLDGNPTANITGHDSPNSPGPDLFFFSNVIDEVLICSGTFDDCGNSYYEAGGPSGTWSVVDPPADAPEPETPILLGSGLLAVFLVRTGIRKYAES